jgi:poly(A) polymerase Pap1
VLVRCAGLQVMLRQVYISVYSPPHTHTLHAPPRPHPSTLAIMTDEFASAVAACEEILFTPAGPGGTPWARLFDPFDFFGSFKNFLQVGAALMHLWRGSPELAYPYYGVVAQSLPIPIMAYPYYGAVAQSLPIPIMAW